MRKKSKVFTRYKSKHKKIAIPQDDDVESDGQLSDDDDELLGEYGAYAGFLRDLNPTALVKNQVVAAGTKREMKTRIDTSAYNEDDDEESDQYSENDIDSDASEDYEHGPRVNRAFADSESVPTRLPAFGADGKMVRLDLQEAPKLPAEELAAAKMKGEKKKEKELAEREQIRSNKEMEKLKKSKGKANQLPEPSLAAQIPKLSKTAKVTPQMRVQARWDAQEALAELASAIIESPEDHMGNLKQMRTIADNPDSTIQKLGLLSQLTVYRDIVPGYRIRPLTDAEKSVQISKDVKKLRAFEEGILTHYQAFLQQLEVSLRKNCSTGPGADGSVAIVAMQCMSELLTTLTHFNFRVNLLSAIVSKMGTRSPVEVGAIACNALCKLFDEDVSGEPSLEAVKLIARMIKNKDFRVDEVVLKTFLHLRLKDEMALPDGVMDKDGKKVDSKKRKDQKQPHVSKKMRKVQKKDGEIESELKEAEATYSAEEKQKNHSETLKFVFLTYFRILKNAESSPLVPSVLEGLSHFGHLINVDFFADILALLKKITVSQYEQYATGTVASSASAKTALHCIVAALLLLSGQGEAVNIDLKDFNMSLYCQLSRLPLSVNSSDARIMDGADETRIGVEKDAVISKRMSDVHSRSEIELVLMGLDLLFCRKKQIQIDRVASFIKRLASVSLHLKPNAVLACLSLQRALFVKHTRLQQLLDPEERLGTGVYKPYLDDAELCNPFATSLWELTLLMKHYHPTVRQFAKHVANTHCSSSGTVTGTKSLPAELNQGPTMFLKKFNTHPEYPTVQFVFVPSVVEPANVTTAVKRRRDMAAAQVNHVLVDGPGIVDPSSFLMGLEKVEQQDAAFLGQGESGGSGSGDAVVDGLLRREQRLRKLVELSHELQIDLMDEDEMDGEDEEDEEDDEEVEDEEESFPQFGSGNGKHGARNGARRAEEFIASLKRK
ncbi:CBF/Mak21 family-domain-containing protein [Chytriomyces cf. hyalinus JEL632]|nr:CBF/Mak21 family-domain-containing protein [Chytriomyces cf. hyalinus JEL632]